MRIAIGAFLAGLVGCSGCPSARLWSGQGDQPFVRCQDLSVPDEQRAQVGALTIERVGRTLRALGSGPIHLAAFSGPAPGRLGAAVEELKGGVALDAAVLIGGVGDSRADAVDTLTRLSALPFPSFVLAGGRDQLEHLTAAHGVLNAQQRQRVWLLNGHHSLQLGQHEFVLLAGAEDGRYGLGADTCGFEASDTRRLAEEAGSAPAGVTRWLLSWMAPTAVAGRKVAETREGVDVGSQAVAALVTALGAAGGLHAWPAVQAAEAVDSSGTRLTGDAEGLPGVHAVVPRLGGPALEGADGSRLPSGFLHLVLGASDIQFRGMSWDRTL